MPPKSRLKRKKTANFRVMEQSYIFEFCTLFDVEQDADIRSYIESKNTIKAKLWK